MPRGWLPPSNVGGGFADIQYNGSANPEVHVPGDLEQHTAGNGEVAYGAQLTYITPFSPEYSLGYQIDRDQNSPVTTASTTFTTANRGMAFPFWVPKAMTVVRGGWMLGSGVIAGNSELGIFDATFNKVVSTGSVANTTVGGTEFLQMADMADTALTPGVIYYMWFSFSDATCTYVMEGTGTNLRSAAMGNWDQAASGPGSMPTTATPATPGQASIPWIVLTARTAF